MNAPLRRTRGFSLVELLVSVVVGMLALMFAMRLVADAEVNKQASMGGSDSMQNGMLAMFSISNDIAQAGWGLNDPLIVGCDTVFTDSSGYELLEAARGGATVKPLAAAVIVAGGSKPDQLSFSAGTSIMGTGSMRVMNDTSGPGVTVDRTPYGFSTNDVILLVPETLGASKCAIAQITNNPAALAPPPVKQTLDTAAGVRFNGAVFGAIFESNKARLYNLGPSTKLAFHTWAVDKGFLTLRATDLAGAAKDPVQVVDNVVSVKAQYGFDTRGGPAFTPNSGMVVASWSANMIDADADGVIGGAGDYQRVAALRLAVVARSRAPERPAPGASCDATPAALEVFGSEAPEGVAAVPITIDVSVTGDAVDWKCYRYRVFESIVPLRNSGWRPSA